MGIFSFLFWYYPLGLQRNAQWTDAAHSRGITTCLHMWIFFAFTSTFANMLIAGIETEQVAGAFLNFFFNIMFAFAGYALRPVSYLSLKFSLIKPPEFSPALSSSPVSGSSCTASTHSLT